MLCHPSRYNRTWCHISQALTSLGWTILLPHRELKAFLHTWSSPNLSGGTFSAILFYFPELALKSWSLSTSSYEKHWGFHSTDFSILSYTLLFSLFYLSWVQNADFRDYSTQVPDYLTVKGSFLSQLACYFCQYVAKNTFQKFPTGCFVV